MKIMFCGDSLTEGFPFGRKYSFPSVIEELSESGDAARVTAVNLGACGTSSREIVARLIDNIDMVKPDMVHLLCGSNDFVIDGSVADLVIANVREAIATCRDLGTPLVISSPPLTNARQAQGMWMPANYDAVNDSLVNYRDLLEEICENEQVIFCDIQSAYKEYAEYCDGVHPTVSGQAYIAASLYKQILNAITYK